MEHDCSLPSSQQPAISPCPERLSDDSNEVTGTHFFAYRCTKCNESQHNHLAPQIGIIIFKDVIKYLNWGFNRPVPHISAISRSNVSTADDGSNKNVLAPRTYFTRCSNPHSVQKRSDCAAQIHYIFGNKKSRISAPVLLAVHLSTPNISKTEQGFFSVVCRLSQKSAGRFNLVEIPTEGTVSPSPQIGLTDDGAHPAP